MKIKSYYIAIAIFVIWAICASMPDYTYLFNH